MSPQRSKAGAWVRRLLVAAALGVLSTMLVAWSLAVLAPLRKSDFREPGEAAHSRRVSVPAGWTVRTWLESTGPGVDHQLVSECVWMGSTLGMTSGLGPQRTMVRAGMGWPFLAMEYSGKDDTNRDARTYWQLGLPVPRNIAPRAKFWRSDPRLPLRPIPLGFAGDVVVHGALWLALLSVAAGLIRRRRRAHGCCACCGYPTQGLNQCPECGEPVRPPAPSFEHAPTAPST